MCHDGWWCSATMQTKRFNGIKKKRRRKDFSSRILMTKGRDRSFLLKERKHYLGFYAMHKRRQTLTKVSTLLKRGVLVDVPPVDVPAVASGQDDRPIEGDFRLTHDGFFRETF